MTDHRLLLFARAIEVFVMCVRKEPYHRVLLFVLALLGGIIPGGTGTALAGIDPQVILQAKRATVGILREPDSASDRWQFKGTGVHLGDGYIVTTRHVVDASGDEKTLRPSVTILTQDFREVPAFLTGDTR
jgi:hypothetical protein